MLRGKEPGVLVTGSSGCWSVRVMGFRPLGFTFLADRFSTSHKCLMALRAPHWHQELFGIFIWTIFIRTYRTPQNSLRGHLKVRIKSAILG